MDVLMNDVLLQAMVPVAVQGAVMLGGTAFAIAQCGKSRAKPVKKVEDRSGKSRSGKSKKSSKSRKSGKSGKTTRSGRSKKSSASAKKHKSSKSGKSRKSGRSRKSKKSSRSGSGKRKSKKSSNSSKIRSAKGSKTSDRAKVTKSSCQVAAEAAARKDEAIKAQSPPKQARESVVDVVKNLHAEPRELRFPQTGGLQKVVISNPTAQRVAIKIKCSDNNLYRVNPVYGFVAPNSELGVDVVRQNGPSKVDKLVFLVAKVSPKLEQAKKAFDTKESLPMIVVPLLG